MPAAELYRSPPSRVFAVIGHSKADGDLSPEDESDLLASCSPFGDAQRASIVRRTASNTEDHEWASV